MHPDGTERIARHFIHASALLRVAAILFAMVNGRSRSAELKQNTEAQHARCAVNLLKQHLLPTDSCASEDAPAKTRVRPV